jgi:hypothetical protein
MQYTDAFSFRHGESVNLVEIESAEYAAALVTFAPPPGWSPQPTIKAGPNQGLPTICAAIIAARRSEEGGWAWVNLSPDAKTLLSFAVDKHAGLDKWVGFEFVRRGQVAVAEVAFVENPAEESDA